MDSNFLGTGLSFPVELSQNDGQPNSNPIKMARYEEAVFQSIWMILGTAPGERVMRPDFGCSIHNLVFADNSAGTIGQMASEVQQALINWEPRIDVLDVEVTSDRNQPNLLLISINYQVRTTNNRFNLVYPFYLE